MNDWPKVSNCYCRWPNYSCYKKCLFLLSITSCSKLLSLRRLRFPVVASPAVENILSTGAEVLGIDKTSTVSELREGYLCFSLIQKPKGSVFPDAVSTVCKYRSTSALSREKVEGFRIPSFIFASKMHPRCRNRLVGGSLPSSQTSTVISVDGELHSLGEVSPFFSLASLTVYTALA